MAVPPLAQEPLAGQQVDDVPMAGIWEGGAWLPTGLGAAIDDRADGDGASRRAARRSNRAESNRTAFQTACQTDHVATNGGRLTVALSPIVCTAQATAGGAQRGAGRFSSGRRREQASRASFEPRQIQPNAISNRVPIRPCGDEWQPIDGRPPSLCLPPCRLPLAEQVNACGQHG